VTARDGDQPFPDKGGENDQVPLQDRADNEHARSAPSPSASPDEISPEIETAFRQLARPRQIGEPLTKADHRAARRVLARYWPRFRGPRSLPERWR
jgi:hypothetical protein